MKKKNKHDLPVFDSDQEYLKAFQEKIPEKITEKNRDQPSVGGSGNEAAEDFEKLLEESFRNKKPPSIKKTPPMPLEKRLKRYPRPEIVLDLHGYTAIGAEVTARSFITRCKQQGFFTLRIIVGKGRHSDLGAVLPDIVEDVAKALKKQDLVLDFEWENRIKSKSGSLIVYLRQFEQFDR